MVKHLPGRLAWGDPDIITHSSGADDPPCPAETSMNNAEELKNSGLKATLPRIKILEVFQRTQTRHMTAEDVFKVLLNEGSDIGLATVYRVLMQFEQAGILSRNHFEAGKAVFELNEGKHHDHLVCVVCGRVEEFYDAEIEKRQQIIAAERGYTLQDHALSLYVVCSRPECQKSQHRGLGHTHSHT